MTYTHEAATTMAFMAMGYDHACRVAGEYPSAILNLGEVELVSTEFSRIARLIEQVWRRHFVEEGFDGVWHYQVSDQMGAWIARYIIQYRCMPSDDELIEAVLSFANEAH